MKLKELFIIFLLGFCCFTLNATSLDSILVRYQAVDERLGYRNDHEVCNLLEDPRGFIWIGSYYGIYKYDGQQLRFFKAKDIDSSIVMAGKINLLTTRSDSMLINVELKGLYWWNTLTHTARKINFNRNQTDLKGIKYQCAYFENDRSLWLASYFKGLVHIDLKTHETTNYLLTTDSVYASKFVSSTNINSIIRLNNEELMLGTLDSLVIFNLQTKTYRKKSIPLVRNDNFVTNIIGKQYQIGPHEFLLCTWSAGIVFYNSETDRMVSYYWNKNVKNGASNISQDVIQENDSIFLIATIDQGCLQFNRKTGVFKQLQYRTALGDQKAIMSFVLFKDRNQHRWSVSKHEFGMIDTRQFTERLSGKTTRQTSSIIPYQAHFLTIAANEGEIQEINEQGIIYHRYLSDQKKGFLKIKQVPRSNLFVLLNEDGYFLFDRTKNQLYGLQDFNKKLGTLRDDLFIIDTEGRIWASQLYDRLVSYNIYTHEFKHYTASDLQHKLPNLEYVLYIFEDTVHNGIWISNFNGYGLVYFNPSTHTVINYSDKYPLINNNPHAVVVLPDSSIFVSLDHFGALRILHPFQPNETMVHYSVEQGNLITNHYTTLVPANDKIWLLTPQGYSIYNSRTNTFTHSPHADFNALVYNSSGLITANNKAIYAVDGELIRVDLDYYAHPPRQQKPYIFQLKIGEQYIPKYISDSTKVTIKYSDVLHLDISSQYFELGEKLFYEWQLSPGSGKWLPMQHTSLTLGRLAPGEYVLRFRSSTDGKGDEWNCSTLFLVVKPPFWRSMWFLLSVIGLTGLLIFIVVQQRIRRIKQEDDLKLQALQSRLNALRAQMNPHFIFNCFNAIDSFILQNKRLEASKLIHSFSKLTRMILEFTAMSEILLSQEVEILEQYLQTEQLRNPLTCEFSIDVEDVLQSVKIPPMLLQPFVENAVIHGIRPLTNRKGFIQIKAVKNGDKMMIEIKDNGVGRKSSSETMQRGKQFHQSMSMAITKERIHAMFKGKNLEQAIQIIDGTELEPGTTILLTLPLTL